MGLKQKIYSLPLIYRILTVLLLLNLFPALNAQYQDFGTWWNVDFSKKINKDFSAGLKVSQRFNENSIRYDRSLATISVEYGGFKDLSIEGGYRLVLVRDNDLSFATRYRFHVNAVYGLKFGDIKISLRDQLQYGFDELGTINDYYSNALTNRTRLKGSYKIYGTPLTAYASYELFLDLNSSYGAGFSGHRIQAGTEMRISNRMDLDLSYMMEDEFNVPYPVLNHIISTSISIDLY